VGQTSSGPVAIRLVVFDIDGVLTDGSFLLDALGHEWKRLRYRDLDALRAARESGIQIALLTAEQGPLTEQIITRLNVTRSVVGAKDKLKGLQSLALAEDVPASQVCYVGDADRDVPALRWAAVGLAPLDASSTAREAATLVLRTAGGEGVVPEVFRYLRSRADFTE